jgi:lipoate-protein ligase B
VPCGISGKQVASITTLCGRSVTLDEVRPIAERHFREVFGYAAAAG